MNDGRMLFFPIERRTVGPDGTVTATRRKRPMMCGGRAGWSAVDRQPPGQQRRQFIISETAEAQKATAGGPA